MIKATHCYIVLHQAIGDTMSTAEIIYYAAGNTFPTYFNISVK